MIAMFSLFIPPLFLVLVRRRVFGGQAGFYGAFISYIFSVLGLNWSMMLILYCFFDSTGDLFSKLGTYSGFACKYILLAMVLAGIEPYVERFFRKDLEIHVSVDKSFGIQAFFRYLRPCAVIYTVLLFILNFIRIFDDNFWLDEAVTLSQMEGTFATITAWAAGDVHPPLYYYMLKIAHMLVGRQGWAYHLLSLLPFLVICILSLTVFWKEFGGKVSLILITFIGLSGNAVTYNMEVRMYSWANLFVLLSFYGVWRILKRQRGWDYIFFAMVSLGAAYTHYFAMISVAFFYLALMFVAVFLKRLRVKAVVVTWIGSIIGYIPWIVVFLKTVLRTADWYWVKSTPAFKEALSYLFSTRFVGKASWIAISASILLFFLYETGLLSITSQNGGKYHVLFSLDRIRLSTMAIWTASGIFCVIGTILFALIYSYVIRPVFHLRYIYAASIVAWIVLANVISRLRWGRIWTVILWLYILIGFIPRYQDIYMSEKRANDTLQLTLEAMGEIETDDVILAQHRHLVRVVSYYYPDNEARGVELDRFPELDKDVCYYLLILKDEDMQRTIHCLGEQGFSCTQIMEDGYMGTFNIDIYRIKKKTENDVS